MTTRHDLADELGRNLALIMKKMKAVRQHQPRVHGDVEPSAYPIFFCLGQGQSRRVSAIAEAVHSDISTISRQLHNLEKTGLLSRSTDPTDGRASVVGLTPAGDELLKEIRNSYAEWLQGILGDWSDEDLAALNDQLVRLYESVGTADELHPHTNTHDDKESA